MSILKERWRDVDKLLTTQLKKYKLHNKILQDEIQGIFDSIKWDFEKSNQPYINRDRLFRQYKVWKNEGIMTPLFSYEVRRLLAKRTITNLEVLGVMLEATYLRLDKQTSEEQLFTTISKNTYAQGLKEANNKPMTLIDTFLIGLITMPNKITGYVWKDYKNGIAKYNAEQVKKQFLLDLQRGTKLDVKNYKDIFESQQKRYLNKKKEEFSGALDVEVAYIVNSTLLQAYLDSGIEKVRFIAVIDEVTSKMCRSLDGQEFFINKKNTFTRYSQLSGDYITMSTNGLESGINLPPINDNFHYCRSTITPERRTK